MEVCRAYRRHLNFDGRRRFAGYLHSYVRLRLWPFVFSIQYAYLQRPHINMHTHGNGFCTFHASPAHSKRGAANKQTHTWGYHRVLCAKSTRLKHSFQSLDIMRIARRVELAHVCPTELKAATNEAAGLTKATPATTTPPSERTIKTTCTTFGIESRPCILIYIVFAVSSEVQAQSTRSTALGCPMPTKSPFAHRNTHIQTHSPTHTHRPFTCNHIAQLA